MEFQDITVKSRIPAGNLCCTDEGLKYCQYLYLDDECNAECALFRLCCETLSRKNSHSADVQRLQVCIEQYGVKK